MLLAATGGKHVPLRFSLCCTGVCTVQGYRQDGVLPCGRSVSLLALSGLQAELSGGRNEMSQEQHPTWAPCTGACLVVFPVHFLLCCDGSDRFISAWVRDWFVLPSTSQDADVHVSLCAANQCESMLCVCWCQAMVDVLSWCRLCL